MIAFIFKIYSIFCVSFLQTSLGCLKYFKFIKLFLLLIVIKGTKSELTLFFRTLTAWFKAPLPLHTRCCMLETRDKVFKYEECLHSRHWHARARTSRYFCPVLLGRSLEALHSAVSSDIGIRDTCN